MGRRLKVPLAFTRTRLQPPNQPWYPFCQAFVWRQAPPIGSWRSPYSSCVHVLGSFANAFEPLQRSDDECCMPKLCAGSCTTTTQLDDALYQVSRAGRSGEPTDARPAHEQLELRVPKYQR